MHTQTQIRPLDVRGANVFRVRPAVAHLGYNLHDWGWGVPFLPVLAIIAVQLNKLREIGLSSKDILHSPPIRVVAIGGELEAVARKARTKIYQKRIGGFHAAFSNY